MNIQIYGSKKSNDTKKAERFFKERRIKFQFVDLSMNRMSEGELNSVKRALKLKLDEIVDKSSKEYKSTYFEYLASEDAKTDKLLDNQTMLIQPIVRNGSKATLGYCPEVWQQWCTEE